MKSINPYRGPVWLLAACPPAADRSLYRTGGQGRWRLMVLRARPPPRSERTPSRLKERRKRSTPLFTLENQSRRGRRRASCPTSVSVQPHELRVSELQLRVQQEVAARLAQRRPILRLRCRQKPQFNRFIPVMIGRQQRDSRTCRTKQSGDKTSEEMTAAGGNQRGRDKLRRGRVGDPRSRTVTCQDQNRIWGAKVRETSRGLIKQLHLN